MSMTTQRISRPRAALVLLLCTLVAGAGLRLAGARSRRAIGMDEGISFLVATGHEGAYHEIVMKETRPFGSWVSASEWKRLLRPDKSFCFKQIGSNLARYDVHPPLYFWMLHLWFLAFGGEIAGALAMNIILSCCTTLCLFGLARSCLRNSWEAALVAFCWTLSPAVIKISLGARMYDVLALCTVLFVWQVCALSTPSFRARRWAFVVLVLATAAGLLTHYHFAVLVAGALLFSIVKLPREDRKRLRGILIAVGLGVLIFLLIHPKFYQSFIVRQSQAEIAPYVGFGPRLERIYHALFGFVVGNRACQAVVAAAVMVLAVLTVVSLLRRCADRSRPAGKVDLTGASILFFAVWLVVIIDLLYLASVSSYQQMGRRYLTQAYPFIAFFPVFFLRFLNRSRAFFAVLFCILLFLSACAGTVSLIRAGAPAADRIEKLNSSGAVIIDRVSRGLLPGILWNVPDDTPVLASSQGYLLAHGDEALSVPGLPALYVSYVMLDNTEEGRDRIIDAIGRRYEVVPAGGEEVWGAAEAYEIRER